MAFVFPCPELQKAQLWIMVGFPAEEVELRNSLVNVLQIGLLALALDVRGSAHIEATFVTATVDELGTES